MLTYDAHLTTLTYERRPLMRPALSSPSESEPSSSPLRGLGVVTRLARAVGVPGRDVLVAAVVVTVAVLSSSSTPPIAQAITGPGARAAVARVMDSESPEAEHAGDGPAIMAPTSADGLIH